MPFTVTNGNRFSSDFTLVLDVSTLPTTAQSDYLMALDQLMNWLALLHPPDTATGIAQEELRKSVAAGLREDADNFTAGRLEPVTALQNSFIWKGRYIEGKARLDAALFTVREEIGADHRAKEMSVTIGNGAVTPEEIKFFADVDTTLTVIRAVYGQQKQAKAGEAEIVLDQYVRKLSGIARLGLENKQTLLAQELLRCLQADYFSTQAPRLKTDYVRILFWVALTASVLLAAPYFAIRWKIWPADLGVNDFVVSHKIDVFLDAYKEFFLLTSGAALGTWLSFASRQVGLSFTDLASLDRDKRGPVYRVLFAIGLTGAAGLLFWTGAVTIGVGNLSTSHLTMGSASGAVALIIGIFCGLSEQALATAISGRATTFVQGVGGTSQTP